MDAPRAGQRLLTWEICNSQSDWQAVGGLQLCLLSGRLMQLHAVRVNLWMVWFSVHVVLAPLAAAVSV